MPIRLASMGFALALAVASCSSDSGIPADVGPSPDAQPAPDASLDGAMPDAGADSVVEGDGKNSGDAPPDAASLDGGDSSGAAPLFSKASNYALAISVSNDPADVYHPAPADLATGGYSFPLVVLLQGAKVDKQHYAKVARLVARYGFVVVVPNHNSLLGLFMELSVVTDVLAEMKAEASDPGSPLKGTLDPSKLGLMGHSYGGVVGLYAIQQLCQVPFCFGSFARPAELGAGAFYGTNMKPPFGPIPTVENAGIPVALIQGAVDGKSLPADTQTTYDNIAKPPKALIALAGANHYGICDSNNPPGADVDANAPTLAQDVANESIARWAATFLRAHLLGDPAAQTYVYQSGAGLDSNATVTSAK